MRLSHLSLANYYGFRDLELSFPERGPTVLIGKNGAGKSTVLDAVAQRRLRQLAGRLPGRRW